MVGIKRIRKVSHYWHRLVTGFMVIWLAVFYSATCEYHGLMLPLNQRSAAQMAMALEPTDTSSMPSMPTMGTHVHHPGMKMAMARLPAVTCKIQPGDTLLQLGRMALNTVALSFLTISAPSSFNVRFVLKQSAVILPDASLAHQCKVTPREPPPRI
ncbi:MAG: hypothetical protein U0350_12125 [Caldilineaceae bacterium]